MAESIGMASRLNQSSPETGVIFTTDLNLRLTLAEALINEHKSGSPPGTFRVWLTDFLRSAIIHQPGHRLVPLILSHGPDLTIPVSGQNSLLGYTIKFWPTVAEQLYQAGARLSDTDYAHMVGALFGAEYLVRLVRYCEPNEHLEDFVRSSWDMLPGYFAGVIGRLLRLGVPAEAFPPGEVAAYEETEPGRWWRLRTGPPNSLLPVLGRDLARYVWQRL